MSKSLLFFYCRHYKWFCRSTWELGFCLLLGKSASALDSCCSVQVHPKPRCRLSGYRVVDEPNFLHSSNCPGWFCSIGGQSLWRSYIPLFRSQKSFKPIINITLLVTYSIVKCILHNEAFKREIPLKATNKLIWPIDTAVKDPTQSLILMLIMWVYLAHKLIQWRGKKGVLKMYKK